MTDFRECFSLDPTGSSSTGIEILKLTEEPRFVSVFTTDCVSVQTHYVNTGDFRGYVQCNAESEGKCLLCDIGRKAERRFLLPVYDVTSDTVQALLISSTISPYSLGSLLRAQMEQGDLDKRYLIISRKFDKYDIRSSTVPNGAETGETTIAEFVERVEKGKDSLNGVIKSLANAEFFNSPEIERSASCLGLKKQDYSPASSLSQTANA